jgi:hypothetical protein
MMFSVEPPVVKVQLREDRFYILDSVDEPIDSTTIESRVPALLKYWQEKLYGEPRK